jgi:hypothetical protein
MLFLSHTEHTIPIKTISPLTFFDVRILRNVIAGWGVKFRVSYSAADDPYTKHCARKVKMTFDSRKFCQCFVLKIAKSWSQGPSFLLSDSNIVFHIWRSMIVKHLQKFLSRSVQITLIMFKVLEVCECNNSLWFWMCEKYKGLLWILSWLEIEFCSQCYIKI